MYIHQFPVIANILIKILKSRYQTYPPWVRNSFINIEYKKDLKMKLISFYGAKLKKKLISNNIRTNYNFLGAYNFTHSFNLEKYYKIILKNLKINTLLMTHPGKNDNYSNAFDDIYDFREKEYLFLKSNKFKECLSKEKIKIVSLNNILNK